MQLLPQGNRAAPHTLCLMQAAEVKHEAEAAEVKKEEEEEEAKVSPWPVTGVLRGCSPKEQRKVGQASMKHRSRHRRFTPAGGHDPQFRFLTSRKLVLARWTC